MMSLNKNRTGFTLIELLIVVAIIAVVVGASMSLITAPLTEKRRATAEEALETGAGALFERMMLDAHAASGVDATTSGSVTFTMADATKTVSYTVDSSGTLVRRDSATATEAKLISNVTEWNAAPDATAPGLWRVRLSATLPGYRLTDNTATKQVMLRVGNGGGQ